MNRVTRNPHDPDYAYDFDNFEIIINGSPMALDTLVSADAESGIVELWHVDQAGHCAPKPGISPKQPSTIPIQGEVVIKVPAERITCTPCTKNNILKRDMWWT